MVPSQIKGFNDFKIEWIQINRALQFLANIFKDCKLDN